MYKSIILSFVVLFFVIGLITVLSVLLIKAAAPDRHRKFYIVTVFGEKDKECSVPVSSVLSILTVLGLLSRCEIIAVDKGMADEEREIIRASFAREARVSLVKTEEISEKF